MLSTCTRYIPWRCSPVIAHASFQLVFFSISVSLALLRITSPCSQQNDAFLSGCGFHFLVPYGLPIFSPCSQQNHGFLSVDVPYWNDCRARGCACAFNSLLPSPQKAHVEYILVRIQTDPIKRSPAGLDNFWSRSSLHSRDAPLARWSSQAIATAAYFPPGFPLATYVGVFLYLIWVGDTVESSPYIYRPTLTTWDKEEWWDEESVLVSIHIYHDLYLSRSAKNNIDSSFSDDISIMNISWAGVRLFDFHLVNCPFSNSVQL